MTNREWLNSLSDEKFAEKLHEKGKCGLCIWEYKECMDCANGITQWLNKKHIEPMPEIKAGDLLFYSKESYYVALTPDKLVTLRGYVVVDLENAIRKDCIIAVKRYMNGELTTIWGG